MPECARTSFLPEGGAMSGIVMGIAKQRLVAPLSVQKNRDAMLFRSPHNERLHAYRSRIEWLFLMPHDMRQQIVKIGITWSDLDPFEAPGTYNLRRIVLLSITRVFADGGYCLKGRAARG